MASSVAEDNREATWKEAAGRTSGSSGYQFGDITRSLGGKLRKWSCAEKTQEGYEFGDLFLKDLVRNVLSNPDGSAGGAKEALSETPADAEPNDADESAEHREIAAKLREQQKEALDLLEHHLPRIEDRLRELESKQQEQTLSGVEGSELYRIKVGSPLSGSPVEGYRNALKEVKATSSCRLDGCFVRCAENCGDLAKIQKSLEQVLKIAHDCRKCAEDVCPAPAAVLPPC